ncbi:hypothetical protein RHSIM_Rhsim10G0008300 [Rhododendron simsii]|uniref:F-box domain-containing protein n=1 Tax=Rhododendron simsii TaxID=118357 RepID=A0A834LDM2_RHOSS|nr:hypothetical protein RHSIM_Rhsim10G0008300 [Rhododendron simsii]
MATTMISKDLRSAMQWCSMAIARTSKGRGMISAMQWCSKIAIARISKGRGGIRSCSKNNSHREKDKNNRAGKVPNLLPELPVDVISEILSRLPVKSLLRFRCVGKSWCSLISDPQLSRPISIGESDYRGFLGSCHGLLGVDNYIDGELNLRLWNPSTRESKRIPEFILPTTNSGWTRRDRVFGEFGFGYDDSNDDYKPNYGDGRWLWSIGVLEESLCVLPDNSEYRADVWVMKEYGVELLWTKLFAISYAENPGLFRPFPFDGCEPNLDTDKADRRPLPFSMAKKGEIVLDVGRDLVLNNYKDETFKYSFASLMDARWHFGWHTFSESLVLPNAYGRG